MEHAWAIITGSEHNHCTECGVVWTLATMKTGCRLNRTVLEPDEIERLNMISELLALAGPLLPQLRTPDDPECKYLASSDWVIEFIKKHSLHDKS